MFKRKVVLLFIASVILMSILTSCSTTKPSDKETPKTNEISSKIINAVIVEDPSTADVQKTSEYYGVPLNIYDRLVECVTIDGKPQLVPGLAETWDVSQDGLVYTFHLVKGVKFHNGEELKADDVLYTINRMMNPDTAAVNVDFFNMIKGANTMFEGNADTVEGVKVIDDYTVEITLEVPFAPFLANLATPGCSIYNRKATEAAGDKFGIDPALTIGTGPFIFSKWGMNEEIVLLKNPDYFKGAPKLDGVRFKIIPDPETQRMMFETGEIDVFDTSYARSQLAYFKTHPKYKDKIISGPEAGLYFYSFNVDVEPFNNVKVRKALQMAIDRQSMVDTMYDGEGKLVEAFIPDGTLGFNPNSPKIEYNPEKAKQLLAEAGYPNGFEMEIVQTADSPATLAMNEVVQSMFEQIGVKVNIKQVDSATYYGLRAEGKLPTYRSVWWADYNDPDNFLYTFFSERNAKIRSSNYLNPVVFAGLEKARTMIDQEERMKLYQELEQILVHEDAIIIPLFQMNHLFILNDNVQNFQLSWNGWSDMSYYNITLN